MSYFSRKHCRHLFLPIDSIERTVEIVKKQLEIEERGVKVRLSVVDTPGYNDSVNGDEK